MKYENTIQRVPARDTDLSGPWLYSRLEIDDSGAAELPDAVLLLPVTAEPDPAGTFHIITRPEVVAAAQQRDMHIHILPVQADAVEKGLLRLAELAGRELGDGLLLRVYRYFQSIQAEDAFRKQALPLLDIRPKSKRAKLLHARPNNTDGFDEHIIAGRIPLSAAELLARFRPDEAKNLHPFFRNLSWSKRGAEEFLTCMQEAGAAQGKMVHELEQWSELQSILDEDLSPKDKLDRLLTRAKELRYPTLTRLERNFIRLSKEVSAGCRHWRLYKPDTFETDKVGLRAEPKDVASLEAAVEELRAMAESHLWPLLFDQTKSGTDS